MALVDTFDRLDVASLVAAGVDLSRVLWVRGQAMSKTESAVDPRWVPGEGVARQRALRGSRRAGGARHRSRAQGAQPGAAGRRVRPRGARSGRCAAGALRRIPFTTWLRVQRAVEGSDTACVLVAPEPLARSAGGLTLTLTAPHDLDGALAIAAARGGQRRGRCASCRRAGAWTAKLRVGAAVTRETAPGHRFPRAARRGRAMFAARLRGRRAATSACWWRWRASSRRASKRTARARSCSTRRAGAPVRRRADDCRGTAAHGGRSRAARARGDCRLTRRPRACSCGIAPASRSIDPGDGRLRGSTAAWPTAARAAAASVMPPPDGTTADAERVRDDQRSRAHAPPLGAAHAGRAGGAAARRRGGAAGAGGRRSGSGSRAARTRAARAGGAGGAVRAGARSRVADRRARAAVVRARPADGAAVGAPRAPRSRRRGAARAAASGAQDRARAVAAAAGADARRAHAAHARAARSRVEPSGRRHRSRGGGRRSHARPASCSTRC